MTKAKPLANVAPIRDDAWTIIACEIGPVEAAKAKDRQGHFINMRFKMRPELHELLVRISKIEKLGFDGNEHALMRQLIIEGLQGLKTREKKAEDLMKPALAAIEQYYLSKNEEMTREFIERAEENLHQASKEGNDYLKDKTLRNCQAFLQQSHEPHTTKLSELIRRYA